MDKPKILIKNKKSLQKEKHSTAVHPLSQRKSSVTPSNNATGLYTLPLFQPSFKLLAINSTTTSSPRSWSKKKVITTSLHLEPSSSEVRNMTYNNYKLQEIPKGEEGFKCSALCMHLPGFGKTKPVKARQEETQMHAVNPAVLSLSKPNSSLEKFEQRSSLVSQTRIHENEGDNSVSSYFDLPSELFKFSSHNA